MRTVCMIVLFGSAAIMAVTVFWTFGIVGWLDMRKRLQGKGGQ